MTNNEAKQILENFGVGVDRVIDVYEGSKGGMDFVEIECFAGGRESRTYRIYTEDGIIVEK